MAFARRLLAEECVQNDDPTASTAFHVCEKLRRSLGTVLGNDGFRMLMVRALAMAKGEVLWLKGVNVTVDGSLQGLDDVEPKLSHGEISDGEVILVAILVGLLVTFIGEALTLRLLHDVWPEASFGSLDSGTEKMS